MRMAAPFGKLTLQHLIGLAIPSFTLMAGVIAIVVLRMLQTTVIFFLLQKMLVKRGIFAQHLPEHVNLKMVCVSIKFSQKKCAVMVLKTAMKLVKKVDTCASLIARALWVTLIPAISIIGIARHVCYVWLTHLNNYKYVEIVS